MLELRPNCENCNKALTPDSTEAMICTFECTFCQDCVEQVLINVCPNCGGGFEKRPIRPKERLNSHPASIKTVLKPVKKNAFLEKNRNIPPHKR
ncbi:MAG: DUF1272 domain-containing protein [Bacteroidia bacterium]